MGEGDLEVMVYTRSKVGSFASTATERRRVVVEFEAF